MLLDLRSEGLWFWILCLGMYRAGSPIALVGIPAMRRGGRQQSAGRLALGSAGALKPKPSHDLVLWVSSESLTRLEVCLGASKLRQGPAKTSFDQGFKPANLACNSIM